MAWLLAVLPVDASLHGVCRQAPYALVLASSVLIATIWVPAEGEERERCRAHTLFSADRQHFTWESRVQLPDRADHKRPQHGNGSQLTGMPLLSISKHFNLRKQIPQIFCQTNIAGSVAAGELYDQHHLCTRSGRSPPARPLVSQIMQLQLTDVGLSGTAAAAPTPMLAYPSKISLFASLQWVQWAGTNVQLINTGPGYSASPGISLSVAECLKALRRQNTCGVSITPELLRHQPEALSQL